MTKIASLKQSAALQVAQYPQYKSHFDNYVLVRIKHSIRTRMGQAFEEGEIAIARPAPESDGKFRAVWSMLNKIDTHIKESELDLVQ